MLTTIRDGLAELRGQMHELRAASDPYGRDTPSPLGRPPVDGGEWVPSPWGGPAEYPWFLKPIPVNTRDVEGTLNDLLRRREPVLVKWLYSTWNADSESIKDQELRNAIRDGDFSEAWLRTWQQRYSSFVNIRMVGQWRRAGDEAHRLWANGLRRLNINHDFDLFGHRMDEWVRHHGGELAVNLSHSQHDALRNVLRYHTIQKPISEAQLAKVLRPIIGLTPSQATAVRNFREALVEDGVPLAQVEHRVQDYASWQRRIRAKRIARTELAMAYNYGAHATMVDASDAGAFDSPLVKQWHTQEDERVCRFCGPLHEAIIGLDETFPGVTERVPNVLVAPCHPMCRCVILYHEVGDLKPGTVPERLIIPDPEAEPEAEPVEATPTAPQRPNTLDPASATPLADDALDEYAETMPARTFQRVMRSERSQIDKALGLTDAQLAELPEIAAGADPSPAMRRKFSSLVSGLRDDSRDYSHEAPYTFFSLGRGRDLRVPMKRKVSSAIDELRKHTAPVAMGKGTKWDRTGRTVRDLEVRGMRKQNAGHLPDHGRSGGFLLMPRKEFATPLRAQLGLTNRGDMSIRDIVWHELGHEFEARNRRASLASKAFFRMRTRGQRVHDRHGFPAKDDRWWNRYMGRIYPTVSSEHLPATEILSMALECLSDPSRAARLYARDPEHFTLGIANLRGRFGYSPGLNQ